MTDYSRSPEVISRSEGVYFKWSELKYNLHQMVV